MTAPVSVDRSSWAPKILTIYHCSSRQGVTYNREFDSLAFRTSFLPPRIAAGVPIHLEDGTGQLRFWPSLLPQETHKRLFEELTLGPDLAPNDRDTTHSSTSGTADKRLFDEPTLSPGPVPIGEEAANNDSGSTSSCARTVEGDSAGRWRQRPIKLFGKEIPQPRLTCFYGRKGINYR